MNFLLDGSKNADGLPDEVTSWSWVDNETGEGVSVEVDPATQRPMLMQQGGIAMTLEYEDDVLASVSFTRDGVDEGTVELNIPLEDPAAGSGRALNSMPSQQITYDVQQQVGYGRRLGVCDSKERVCDFVSNQACKKWVGCAASLRTCGFLITSGCAPCAIFGCLGLVIFGCYVDMGFQEVCAEGLSEDCGTVADMICEDDDDQDDPPPPPPKRGEER